MENTNINTAVQDDVFSTTATKELTSLNSSSQLHCSQDQDHQIIQLRAHIQSIEQHHENALLSLQARIDDLSSENKTLQISLQEEKDHAAEIESRAEHTNHLRDALKELSRQIKFLESRNTALRTELAETVDSHKNALNEKIKERDDALTKLQYLQQDAKANKETHAAVHALAKCIIASNDNASTQHPATENSLACIENYVHTSIEQQKLWKNERTQLVHEVSSLREQISNEQKHNQQLSAAAEQTSAELIALRDAHDTAEKAEAELQQCREELAAAAAKAASAVLDAQYWQEKAADAHFNANEAEQHASKARKEADSLVSTANARNERVVRMREAAATALESRMLLQNGVNSACLHASEMLERLLTSHMSESSNREEAAHATDVFGEEARNINDAFGETLTESLHCLRQSRALLSEEESPIEECVAFIQTAFDKIVRGYACVAVAMQEHRRIHSALTNALSGLNQFDGIGTDTHQDNCGDIYIGGGACIDTIENSGNVLDGGQQHQADTIDPDSSKDRLIALTLRHGDHKELKNINSLEYLLESLLDKMMHLMTAMKDEKDAAHVALDSLHATHREVQMHAASLQSVLMTLPDGDSSIQLAMAKERIGELESCCAALSQRVKAADAAAADAKAAANRGFTDVKADIAHLVRTAELAHVDAEVALQRQRAETARQVNEARTRELEAAAARSLSEAQCAALREENLSILSQLHSLRSQLTSAETRAHVAETTLKDTHVVITDKKKMKNNSVGDASTGDIKDENTELLLKIAYLEDCIATLEEESVIATVEMQNVYKELDKARALAVARENMLKNSKKNAENALLLLSKSQEEATGWEMYALDLETQLQAVHKAENEGEEERKKKKQQGDKISTIRNTHANEEGQVAAAAAQKHCKPLHQHPVFAYGTSQHATTTDVALLQRRLHAALHQVESMNALNRNLEQQLAAAMHTNDKTHSTNDDPFATKTNDDAKDREQLTHAMIDALESLHSTAKSAGESSPSKLNRKQYHLESLASPSQRNACIQRVVNLWKEACLRREERLQEMQAQVQSLRTELVHRDAQLVAMESALNAAKSAKDTAFSAVEQLNSQFTELDLKHRSTERKLEVALQAAKDAEHRVSSEMQGRLSSAESTIDSLRASIEKERVAAVEMSEMLGRVGDVEKRVFEAEQRAHQAEEALAKHLCAISDADATSMGQKLERAWDNEKALARKVHDLRMELAEAHGKIKIMENDLDVANARCDALQAQLTEAVGALAEQGSVVEKLLQRALAVDVKGRQKE